ncbi:putative arabinose efflux permease, MFS family [Streptoalloteichus tenebrarius]|uniref:Arabinose efflux permease, MFS family n=1 Tax=Streptoalloteichus tenebrarius (strain ATCC 17920 / DSM 40477 / JCM 4838 / CBS 697.72 / NBRC 16177 / NCIMB 11028 / NRRL B-12390 / A12253. 1 / ISP 5477) TaxID=1933 RepID=A0ABT1I1A5_STRSD|nr:MFS transporter [Streptoalloteichus tenebrarius]MCP2261549.1 putative arabinose efflux permease, MFS family [Streptoalloteichus tenebrarius]BFF02676.1 MFS transporter [Streptoalloteichus tenebrarius]
MRAMLAELLRTPRLPSVWAWSLLARLHVTATGIALSLHVAGWTDSYLWAGVVSAGLALGSGAAGPLRGRAVDRRPSAPILVITGVLYSAGLAALAFLPPSLWWLGPVIALATGLFLPPATQVSRVVLPRMVPERLRASVYSMEAAMQELLFIAGPVGAAAAVSLSGARAAVLLCAGMALAGSLGFAWSVRRAGVSQPERPDADPADGARPAASAAPRRGGVLAVPGVLPLAAAYGLLGVGFNALDLALVAWARDRGTPGLAGVLALVWALGSLVGGLYAARGGGPGLVGRVLLAAVGQLAVAPFLPPLMAGHPVVLGAALLVSGTTIAPAIGAIYTRLGEVAPAGRRAEAFGWLSTTATTGAAVGAPLAGALLDGLGPAAAVALASSTAWVGVLVVRRVPKLPRPADESVREDART